MVMTSNQLKKSIGVSNGLKRKQQPSYTPKANGEKRTNQEIKQGLNDGVYDFTPIQRDLEKTIKFRTFERDLEDMFSIIKETSSKWQNPETMKANREKIEGMQTRINAYKEYMSVFGKPKPTFVERKEKRETEKYRKAMDEIDSLQKQTKDVLDNWDALSEEYSKHSDEEEYNHYASLTEEKRAMASVDMDAVQKEVSDLETILKTAKRYQSDYNGFKNREATVKFRSKGLSDNRWTEEKKIAKKTMNNYLASVGYKDIAEIEKALGEKKKYRNEARWVRIGIKMADVADPTAENYDEEFEKHAAYKPRKKPFIQFGNDSPIDETYDYINADAQTKLEMKSIDRQPNVAYLDLDNMTAKEKATFNYYYNKYGKGMANKYFSTISERLANKTASKRFEGLEGETGREMLFGVEAGLDQFMTGLRNLGKTDESYIPVNSTQQLSGMVRDDLDDRLGGWGTVPYDFINTTANMAPSIATSAAVGTINPVAGAATGAGLMGASAGGNAYQEMVNQGYDPSQARTYATIVGVSEAGLQYALGGIGSLGGTSGKVAKMVDGIDNAAAKFAIQYGGSVASEGLEEGLQEVLAPVFKNIAAGYDTGEEVDWGNVFYSALLGGMSGGFLGGAEVGAQTYSNYTQNKAVGQNIKANERVGDMFAMAATPEMETAYEAYNKYTKKGITEENVSDSRLGNLYSKAMADAQAMINSDTSTQEQIEAAQKTIDQLKVFSQSDTEARTGSAHNLDDSVYEAYDTESIVSLIEEGLESGADTEAHKIATEYKEKVENFDELSKIVSKKMNGEELSADEAQMLSESKAKLSQKEIATLMDANDKAIRVEERDDIKAKLIEKGESEEIADIAARKMRGETLTTEESAKLLESEEALSSIAEVSNAENVTEELIETAKTMDKEKGALFVSLYDGKTDIEAYTNAFNLAVMKTENNFGIQDVIKTKNVLSNAQVGKIYSEIAIKADQAQRVKFQKLSEKTAKLKAYKGVIDDTVIDYNNTSAKGKVNWNSLDSRQRKAITFVKGFAQATGLNLTLVTDGKERGMNGAFEVEGNEIILDIYAGIDVDNNALTDTIIPTMSHELTHWMEKKSPVLYRKLCNIVFDTLQKKDGLSEWVRIDRERRRLIEKGLLKETDSESKQIERARSEIVARACEDILSRSKVGREMFNSLSNTEKKTLIEKIHDIIQDIKDWINDVLGTYKSNAPEAKILRDYQEELDRLSKVWDAMITESVEVNQALEKSGAFDRTSSNEGDILKQARELQRKDAKKLTEEEFKTLLRFVKGRMLDDNTYIPARVSTPQILIEFAKEQGFTLENNPLAMRVYKARQALSNESEWDGDYKDKPHDLSVDEVIEIVKGMNNPSYLVYQTINDRFAEIVKFEKEGGKQKAYAIIDFFDVEKNPEYMNGYKGGKYNILVTIYPSENSSELKEYLNNKNNVVMTGEQMKKKAKSQRGSGSYMPSHLNDIAFFDNSVSHPDTNVKEKFSIKDSTGRELSEGQIEYFKDSKVRDENGSLQVMYRGDSNEFTVFDRKKTSYANLYGRGFYFTKSKSHAEQYGNAREFYLDIKNPLLPKQNVITKEQMLNFLTAIENDGEDYDLYNYGQDATAESVLNSVWGKGDFEMLQDISAGAIGDLVAAVELFNEVNGTNYDGIILPTETVIFNSEQAKLTSNLNPTKNKDIRYSERTDGYAKANELQREINEIDVKITDIHESDSYSRIMDIISKSIADGDMDRGAKEYEKWADETGYEELSLRKKKLQDEVNGLRKKLQEAYERELIEKEQKSIAKSGLSEADYFRKQAVKEFGYTPFFYDAGYITPNGKMLNFSGEKGMHYGTRGEDHRAIGIVYANVNGSKAMVKFMSEGNIRIMAESPGLDVSSMVEPTKEQYATIRKFVREYAREQYFNIDITDEEGQTIGNYEYSGKIVAERVVNDIKYFFENGTTREKSSVAEFLYSERVTDDETIEFLENQEHIKTYKAMQLIDGKLYPPMAAKTKGSDGKYHLTNPSEIGVWQQAVEDTSNIKFNKKGIGYYTLNKGNGKSITAAYNPYEHSSNLVLNDQFEEAHQRPNIVTVECVIPKSEMTSGYKAQYAKDSTGVLDWKSGVVAGKIKDNKRMVYLSRWLKPIRILSDAETAKLYKEALGETNVSVPFNVVTPSLLKELERIGVSIDYKGSPLYRSAQERKRADTNDKDTRHSERDDVSVYDAVGEAERIKAENEKLKADIERLNERLKLEGKITGGKLLNNDHLLKAAGHLRSIAKSDIDKVQLAKSLKEFYIFISQSEHLAWEDVFKQSYSIAESIIEEAKPEVMVDDYSKMILKEIRTKKISFSEQQKAEAKYRFGKNWNRSFIGNVTIKNDAIPLESQWQEWASNYPDIFDAGIGETDMVEALYDVIGTLRDSSEIIMEYDKTEQTRWLANEVYNQFWNVSNIRTTADKFDKKIKLLNSEHRNAMAELRESYKARMEEKAKNQKLADDIHYGKLINKLKIRKEQEVDLARKRGYERLNKYKENAERKTIIQSTMATAMALNKKLTTNSKDVHIPQELKPVVINLLNSIDFSSKQMLGMTSKKVEDKWGTPTKRDVATEKALEKVHSMDVENPSLKRSLQAALELFEDAGKVLVEGSNSDSSMVALDVDMIEELKKLINDIDIIEEEVGYAFVLQELSNENLKTINKTIKSINHWAVVADKALANKHKKRISELGIKTIEENDVLGERQEHVEAVESIKTFFSWRNLLPANAFKRLGTAAMEVFDGLRDAQDKVTFNRQDVYDFMDGLLKKHKGVKKWRKDIKTFKLNLPDGEKKEIKMPVSFIMSLYCISQPADAQRHLFGHDAMGNDLFYTDDKGVEHTGGGMTISRFNDKGLKVSKYLDNIIVNADIVNQITNALTKEQREVADLMQGFMNTKGSEWGDAVSMALYGIKKFGVENYFPITVSPHTLNTMDTEDRSTSMFSILNYGFTKERNPHANQSIEIGDIFDVFANHMNMVAIYNAYALPIYDIARWYNFKGKTDKGMQFGVSQSIENTFGKGATSYVKNLIKDLNGQHESSRLGFITKIFKNTKVAMVGNSLSVALLQPTAYFKAMTKIPPQYLLKSLLNLKDGSVLAIRGVEKAKKYCGIALLKSQGYFETGVSVNATKKMMHDETFMEKVTEKSLWGAGVMDERTWGLLWNACEFEVRAKRKDLKVGSPEFYEVIADKLRDVIYETQVVDSPLTKSDLMRSSDTGAKMVTMFASEMTVAYNMVEECIYNAVLDYKRYGRKSIGRSSKNILMTLTSYTATSAVVGLLNTVVQNYRYGDDEEKEFMEQVKDNFFSDWLFLGKIPYIRDAISISQGYSSSRTDLVWLDSAKKAYDAWQKIEKHEAKASEWRGKGKSKKAAQYDEYADNSRKKLINEALKSASYFSGVAGYNQWRDLRPILKSIGIID